jgi:hypothetical protein
MGADHGLENLPDEFFRDSFVEEITHAIDEDSRLLFRDSGKGTRGSFFRMVDSQSFIREAPRQEACLSPSTGRGGLASSVRPVEDRRLFPCPQHRALR